MNRKVQKGFTLIEMLVVIAIISILIGIGVNTFTIAQKKARDVRRKTDLRTIQAALELYKHDYGKYPPPKATSAECSGQPLYGANCYTFSTQGDWLSTLGANYLPQPPKDPINNSGAPWELEHYSYSYGNVSADGQMYDLTTQLENTNDPERCGVKLYYYHFNTTLWCGSYSTQIYEPPELF